MPSTRDDPVLARLEADGLLIWNGTCHRTSRRWQAALARSAFRLLYVGATDGSDLRLPIAMALFEIYGESASDEDLARRTEAMLPIEMLEVEPELRAATVPTHAER